MRRSPRNLRIAFDHRGLTHFGGVYFFHEFLQLLQLRDFLARHLSYPRRNRRYSLSQMILALVYPLVLGLDRLETASFLRSNGTFQYLTGLPSFPDPQTLRRFLLHAPDSFWEQMHRVNDRLLQNFVHLPEHRSRLIFDLDSTRTTKDHSQAPRNRRHRAPRCPCPGGKEKANHPEHLRFSALPKIDFHLSCSKVEYHGRWRADAIPRKLWQMRRSPKSARSPSNREPTPLQTRKQS